MCLCVCNNVCLFSLQIPANQLRLWQKKNTKKSHSSSEQEVQREQRAQQVWEHFKGPCRTTSLRFQFSSIW